MMGSHPTILIFDSGFGGLTVYREVAAARPDANFIFVADDAAFPYGQLAETVLVERLVRLTDEMIGAHRPDLIVIACNTASTIALPELRKTFSVPFVGTVPAIKPACAASVTKRVSVLGTEATVKREYTRALIRDHAQGCEVDLVGSKQLAAYAEAELHGRPATDMELRTELEPCFRDGAKRTDTIVLACTHYPLLTERLRHIALWPVSFIDPAPAIARRVVQLLGEASAAREACVAWAFFTSGKAPASILARFGLVPGNPARSIDPAAPA
jgi:glutamate racemase